MGYITVTIFFSNNFIRFQFPLWDTIAIISGLGDIGGNFNSLYGILQNTYSFSALWEHNFNSLYGILENGKTLKTF